MSEAYYILQQLLRSDLLLMQFTSLDSATLYAPVPKLVSLLSSFVEEIITHMVQQNSD